MRNAILVIALTVVAAPASAQTMIAVRAGASWSSWSSADLEDIGHRGHAVGVDLLLAPAGSRFSLRLGGMHARKGAGSAVASRWWKETFDYLQLGPQVRIGLIRLGTFSVGPVFGPWYARRLSRREVYSREGWGDPLEARDRLVFGYRSATFGVAFGGSAELRVGKGLMASADVIHNVEFIDVWGEGHRGTDDKLRATILLLGVALTP